MDLFEYTNLDQTKLEIRLLSRDSEPLAASSSLDNKAHRLSIKNVSLHEKPDFIALSYVWGPIHPQTAISLRHDVNLQPGIFTITHNLAQLLPELVAYAADRSIWVDAVCINQQDDDEKSWQVALMQQIYQQAASVFIWLGPDADNGAATLTRLDAVGQKVFKEPVLWRWEYLYWYNLFHTEPPSESDLEHLKGPGSFNSIEPLLQQFPVSDGENALIPFTDTQKLLQRTWWQRVFVFQEIVLPGIDFEFGVRSARNENIVFACAKSRSNLNHVAAALTVFRLYLSASAGGLYGSGTRMVVPELDARSYLMLSARMWTGRVPLLTLLKATSSHTGVEHRLGATDPRDRVYALLGICSDAGHLSIRPDYTKDVQHVYTDTTAALIKQHGPDVILQTFFPKRLKGLPSWVTDWSAESIGYRINLPQGTTEHRFDKFLYDVKPPFRPAQGCAEKDSPVAFSENSRLLHIKGIELATVSNIINTDVWQHFLGTAARLLELPQFVGRPHAVFSPNYQPPANEEEAQARKIENARRQMKPLTIPQEPNAAEIAAQRNSSSAPFIPIEIDPNHEIWQSLRLNPGLELEYVDVRNYKAYLQCIRDLHTGLRELCVSQLRTYPDDDLLENAIWRTPVADQGVVDDIRNWKRPSSQARNAILFDTVMYDALPLNSNVNKWPPWIRDTWLQWVRHKLTQLGIFTEDPSLRTIRYMFINPLNEPRVNIIQYAAGRYALGIRRYPNDGKGENDLCSIMYRPLDELVIMCQQLGSLKGEQYETKERVNQGLLDGSIQLQDIIRAVQIETHKAIEFDEPQLIGLMTSTVRYLREAVLQAVGRSVFVTTAGYLGLGAKDVKPGDVLVSLVGAKSVMILRPVEKGQHEFIGEAFVYGELAKTDGDAGGDIFVREYVMQ